MSTAGGVLNARGVVRSRNSRAVGAPNGTGPTVALKCRNRPSVCTGRGTGNQPRVTPGGGPNGDKVAGRMIPFRGGLAFAGTVVRRAEWLAAAAGR